MYKKLIRAMESLNILFQALYTLALPVGLGAIVSYLLTKYTSVDGWIWAVLLTLGTSFETLGPVLSAFIICIF